jgi:nuclear pore complex protein Nup205
VEYQINEDFQQGVLNVADALELDELYAAKLFLNAQYDAERMRRNTLITAIVHFQDQRLYVLDCLRLIFKESLNNDLEEGARESMRSLVSSILASSGEHARAGSFFTRRCIASLRDIERRIQNLGEQLQRISVVGMTDAAEVLEVIEYQRTSLANQHESLGAIVCYLFKGNYATPEDFRIFLDLMRVLERFDRILFHYIPALVAAIVQFGSCDSGNLQDARSLHQKITSTPENEPWSLHSLHAATIVMWLSEYSGWYGENDASLALEGVDFEEEAERRSNLFMTALADGALQFILAVCSSVTSQNWHDPARQELVNLLLADANGLTLDGSPPRNLTTLLMEHFETFAESCIANMPDAVRRLKAEEDQLRLGLLESRERIHLGTLHSAKEAPMHLECFLVIIAFAYEHRPEAAEEFWIDPDGNLFGFLHWASKRQTVPRVSAFCEMLCAVSEGEDCSRSAHRFLLEEGQMPAKKLKRTASMSWAQMFAELQLYAARVGERSSTMQNSGIPVRRTDPSQMSEPESPLMLACYLRLTTHMCRHSSTARMWLLSHTSFDIRHTLLVLNCASIPAHLRASIFATLEALMTEKTLKIGEDMWSRLDSAFSGSLLSTSSRPAHLASAPAWSERLVFEVVSNSFEESNSFVSLLNSITSPSTDIEALHDALPFPESLGSTYRMPGIDPYIDLILGQIFAKKLPELQDKTPIWMLRCTCLDFIATCLSTFNEDLVVIANQVPDHSIDASMRASSLKSYVQLHPFSRTMEWLFNDDVARVLFAASHHDMAEVGGEDQSSPLVLSVLKSIQVMNLVFDMQATYLDLVRPLIKEQLSGRRQPVANSSIASFEDFVSNHPRIVADLSRYCGTGHLDLTLTSLSLLKKLSSSRKLNKNANPTLGRSSGPSKVIEMLESEVDSDQVARLIVEDLESDAREIETGPVAPGYQIKLEVFAFLNSCLAAIPNRPNIAHIFLGFSHAGNALILPPDGQFVTGLSLFHTILRLVQTYPFGTDGQLLSWMMQIKQVSLLVLRALWTSPLSSTLVVPELRQSLFLSSQFVEQPLVTQRSLWDGRSISSEEFLIQPSSNTLTYFLRYRSMLYEYAVTELRFASREGSSSMQAQILSTLMGNSTDVDGENVSHVSIFDLFDFADLDVSYDERVPDLTYLHGIDLNLCAMTGTQYAGVTYDISALGELVELKRIELMTLHYMQPSSPEELQFKAEADILFVHVFATNQARQIQSARLPDLRCWVELIMVVVEVCQMDERSKTTLILQALQVILPRLERAMMESITEATEMARLVATLTKNLKSGSLSNAAGRAGDVINDRLFQLFRVCVRGIAAPQTSSALRDLFYTISSQYLARMTDETLVVPILRRQSMQVIKSAGERFIDLACDDSFVGQEDSKTSALLLLNLLVCLAKQEESTYMVDSFVRLNYLGMLVDSIKNISVELQDTDPQGEFNSIQTYS